MLNNDLTEIYEKYENISELDAKIIYLRKDFYSYRSIQLRLGNPSKKYIRNVLLKYEPNLIDLNI